MDFKPFSKRHKLPNHDILKHELDVYRLFQFNNISIEQEMELPLKLRMHELYENQDSEFYRWVNCCVSSTLPLSFFSSFHSLIRIKVNISMFLALFSFLPSTALHFELKHLNDLDRPGGLLLPQQEHIWVV
jgi:hypothetical protein